MRQGLELESWLNLVPEDPLEPELPICDAHHHLWNGPGDRGRYLLEEFLRDAGGGHNIVQTVFVECGAMYRPEGPEAMRAVGETEFAQNQATQSASGQFGPTQVAQGIIAFADLSLGPAVAPVLEAHATAGAGRLRGIRHICTWDDDPSVPNMGISREIMADARFRAGFACLQDFGLSFDAWQYFAQLPQLADLARSFPATTIIVNHCGGPLGTGVYASRRDQVFAQWQQNMALLLDCPNVVVKLGGLGMPRCGFGWHRQPKPPDSTALADVLAPYFNFCIERFGVKRCMFESNFPMDKPSYGYTVMFNAFKRITAGASSDEKAALFHDTAVRIYQLSDQNRERSK